MFAPCDWLSRSKEPLPRLCFDNEDPRASPAYISKANRLRQRIFLRSLLKTFAKVTASPARGSSCKSHPLSSTFLSLEKFSAPLAMLQESKDAGVKNVRRIGLKAFHRTLNRCCKRVFSSIGGPLAWSAYQKLSRVIRPSIAIVMRNHTKAASLDDLSRLNEKQRAWIERSHHCWKLYRSLARVWDLVSRLRSWSVVAS